MVVLTDCAENARILIVADSCGITPRIITFPLGPLRLKKTLEDIVTYRNKSGRTSASITRLHLPYLPTTMWKELIAHLSHHT
jgi:hypothetical protein